MLQNIHIQNFRCFEDFKAEGFERINLIGGKNNSGKSCLLEGIAMLSNSFKLKELVTLRGEQAAEIRNIKSTSTITRITPFLPNNDNTNDFFCDTSNTISNTNGNLNITYITQENELPRIDILKSFDVFDEKLIKHKIIEILKIIDSRIEDIRTFKTKEGLWFKKFNEEYQPIVFYGDATKKIIKYFTSFFEKKISIGNFITSNDDSILLIDEIENGIHYTAHKEFWQHLFKLCKELNVQVFATTHSLEMIKAFNEVALEEGEASYFEMMRNEVDNIELLKHPPQILQEEFELKTPKFRGEEYKTSINLAKDLMETLNQASIAAKEKLKENGLAVPYVEDGWIWQLLPDGSKQKIEKLETVQ